MLETALKLSDSRLLLLGAIFTDTVAFGTLATISIAPSLIQQPSSLLLISFALTCPILALTVGGCAALVPTTLDAEERARRAILAGLILHLGIQLQLMLKLLSGCSCGPRTIGAYMGESALPALIFILLTLPLGLWLRRRKNL